MTSVASLRQGVAIIPGITGQHQRNTQFGIYNKGDARLEFRGEKPIGGGVFRPVAEFSTMINGRRVGVLEGGSADTNVNPNGPDGKISGVKNTYYAGDMLSIEGVDLWGVQKGANNHVVLTTSNPDMYSSRYLGLEFNIMSADGKWEYAGPAQQRVLGQEAATLINGAIEAYHKTLEESVK